MDFKPGWLENVNHFVHKVLMLYLNGELRFKSENTDIQGPKDLIEYIKYMEEKFCDLILNNMIQIRVCLEQRKYDDYDEIIQRIVSEFPNYDNIDGDSSIIISDLLNKCINKICNKI